MKSAAVISAKGIGDGLIMMVASHRLHNLGFNVTTYHNALHQMEQWFPGHTFKSLPQDFETECSKYDLVIVQNDNSEKIKQLKNLKNLSIFYPTYEPHKHSPLSPIDQVFKPNLSMVDNVAKATSSLLHLKNLSKNNGIATPLFVRKSCFAKRVAIHACSAEPQKNWPKKKFFKLAIKLKNLGFQPAFVMSPQERKEWEWVMEKGFELPHFPLLSDVAQFIAESGFLIGNDSSLGHLASNLHIPTLIISSCKKRMQLWRPGWLKGVVLTPWEGIPNFKFFRLREQKWTSFISVEKVLKNFILLSNDNGFLASI